MAKHPEQNYDFEVVGIGSYDPVSDSVHIVTDGPWDDDAYWVDQREADEYRDELDDQLDREELGWDYLEDEEYDFDDDDDYRIDDFGAYGPGVDDFDHDNTWGIG